MPTFKDLVLSISQLPSGSTLLEHLQSVGASPTLLAEGLRPKYSVNATKGQSKKNYFTNSLPQVHITDNSVPAIQQAIDELVRNIGRVSKK